MTDADKQFDADKQGNMPKPGITAADKIKFAGLIIFLIIVAVATVQLLPYFEGLTSAEGRLALVTSIQEQGFWGVLIVLGLQFLQVVVAFIPGEVVQLIIGMVYGTFFGSLITLLGALIPSVVVFYVVRKLGTPFVDAMVGQKDAHKLKFLHNSKSLNTLVFVLYLIPGLPKDLFNYVVPLTKMKPQAFFVLSTLGRVPGIVASAYIGTSFLEQNYVGMIIAAVLIGGVGIIGIIFNEKIMAFVNRVTARFARKRGVHDTNGDGLSSDDSSSD
ncbi:MAG: TVP38/TMEM64 family protein [Coriobacteriales bacterium]|jgi:uncharacterized membrane protein YdjX (TVP38/TMEM64 family)|nr:TVP38/TMEM64 family protein [Coriobacteriales bacterium]